MVEVLTQAQVENPSYAFEQGAEFVATFGEETGAQLINPIDHPMAFAEAVAQLNPRHPKSPLRVQRPGADAGYQDRYAAADNGLPIWAAPYENVIYNAAHGLRIRDRELGTTIQYDFEPGKYQLGLVLEGANNASGNRGDALAQAIRDGVVEVDEVAVSATDRKVGEKETHGDLRIGYAVGARVVAKLREDHPDVFGKDGVKLNLLPVRTHDANTREVVAEAALRHNVGSVVMSGSNIYASWMRTDLANVGRTLGLERVSFGAGPDDPKAARTPVVWTAEVAHALVSAAELQHTQNTKRS